VLAKLTSSRRGEEEPEATGMLVEDVKRGVSVSWLAQVFNMDPKTVKARLADCPPLHRRKAGYVYDLPQACQYLVKPAFDSKQFLKSLKSADLPPAFQDAFWGAALKRQKWEENAGDLWRTGRVREVFSNVFQLIKSTVQLWTDTVERQVELSKDQKNLIRTLSDSLQQQVYEALLDHAEFQRTPNQLDELSEMLGEAQEEQEDDDDDITSLI
jgi:hypothetical protein